MKRKPKKELSVAFRRYIGSAEWKKHHGYDQPAGSQSGYEVLNRKFVKETKR